MDSGSADERARLYREQQPSIVDEPWSTSDLYCLDELSYLLNGEVRTYGHVVVDEAQDLSPMQARALARRCPSGSFTVLGDLAQATGAWVRDDWSELTAHLGDAETAVETLTIGYRVQAAALELAGRLLPLISPGLSAPQSVRVGAGAPTVHLDAAEPAEERALQLALNDIAEGRKTAIVVADQSVESLLAHVRSTVIPFGNGRDGDFSQPLTVVPASAVKGLEFDSVIVLGPTELVTSTPDGRRLLYVAMTRCTHVLRLVDGMELPDGLNHLAPRKRPVPEPLFELGEPDTAFRSEVSDVDGPDALIDLIACLDDDDRELVAALARRLLQEGARD